MLYFAEGTEAMIALEKMVDKVGVRNVIYALAHICDMKAEHQDVPMGKRWARDATLLDKLAPKINAW